MSDEVTTLSTGVKAILKPVPTMLIDKLVGRIPDPEVPRQFIEEKQREEENRLAPSYLKAVDDVNRLRGEVTMEALIIYGIELVDGVPPVEEWLPKLQWFEKRGELDLSEWDLDDPLDLEFVYKGFVAASTQDLMVLSVKSGLTNEEVMLAMRSFRGDEVESPDLASERQTQGTSRDPDKS